MTRVIEKYQKLETRYRTIEVICDRCEVQMTVPEPQSRNLREFELIFAEGWESGYGGGGYKSGWQVEDLCDNCVRDLRKILENRGFKVKPYEVDW